MECLFGVKKGNFISNRRFLSCPLLHFPVSFRLFVSGGHWEFILLLLPSRFFTIHSPHKLPAAHQLQQ
jgi:hypothetical protein